MGAWFHRCRTELGDVGVGVFRKLITSLVDSTMLYGSEIWGCNWDLHGEDRAGSDEGPEIVLWCRNSTSKGFTFS